METKRKHCGDMIYLSLVKDIDDKKLWATVYTAFYKMITLRINVTNEMLIADEWDAFKKHGEVLYRIIDEAQVNDIISDLRREVLHYGHL